jgi:hypothetical protein
MDELAGGGEKSSVGREVVGFEAPVSSSDVSTCHRQPMKGRTWVSEDESQQGLLVVLPVAVWSNGSSSERQRSTIRKIHAAD